MISKPLAVGLLAAGCLVAAAGGAYLATRSEPAEVVHNQQPPATAPAQATQAPQAVSESEGIVSSPAKAEAESAPATAPAQTVRRPSEPVARSRSTQPSARVETPRNAGSSRSSSSLPAGSVAPPSPSSVPTPAERPAAVEQSGVAAPVAAEASTEPSRAPEREAPQVEEVVVPSASVIGLQVETSVSSERARPEDRVDARVTRDVMAGSRVAIPAGARVLGTVIAVDRGGKIKERARLDVRFHTLVLADGAELPMRTETISRFGESPTGDSARKIGGAAVGGAILGAILGGGKGAVLGGATGAAGGTAVVMAGDRNAATLPAGTVLSVRLTSPVSIQVEK